MVAGRSHAVALSVCATLSQVRVKGFLRRSGGDFPVVVISTGAAQAGGQAQNVLKLCGHISVLYGPLSGVLTLFPRVGG